MDLGQLRTQIKTWERDFASVHGRDPCITDIRDDAIADKYRLYKKLSKACLPAPKSRPADDRPSLPGFNPFSPTKKAASSLSRAPRTSPFATPTKNRPIPRRTTSPSPGPFSPIAPPLASTTTAVSRARKRLRGDPVSPSPSKPKRQRIPPPSTDHESDHELPLASSFVADSPVKAPAGGKSFKVLFDDVLPALSIPKKLVPPLPDPALHPPFLHRPSSDPFPSLKLNRSSISSKLNLLQRDVSSAPSQVSQPRPSIKRTLDLAPEHAQPPQTPLVPPSPPPQEPASRDSGKPKVKPTASRKKPRMDDQDSDDGLDVTLKIATRKPDRATSSHRHPDDVEWDPLLPLPTHNHDPATDEILHASSTFRVDLPDKFRHVLAISPSRSQSGLEERVVRGLLSGHRVGNYDPSRGGGIWDAGESNECSHGDADTEDDWESEPVPWEVGEL